MDELAKVRAHIKFREAGHQYMSRDLELLRNYARLLEQRDLRKAFVENVATCSKCESCAFAARALMDL